MKYIFKIFCITGLLLGGYSWVLNTFNVSPQFAESNYVANQMRLQAMERAENDVSIVAVGSSLTARLKIESLSGEKEALNLGLDGSNAIFGGKSLFEDGKIPEVLLIEMNTLHRHIGSSNDLLREGMQSGTNRLSRVFIPVRAESRPVTLLYSALKSWKDGRYKIALKASDYQFIKPTKNYEAKNNELYKEFPEVELIISEAQSLGVRVILLFMPDGYDKAYVNDVLAEKLSKEYEIEVLDLKRYMFFI